MLQDDEPAIREFAEVWRATEKVVYSRTLASIEAPTHDCGPGVRPCRRTPPAGRVRQGPRHRRTDLAAEAIAAGLVDEYHLFVNPVIVGAGLRALPVGVRLDLTLVGERRFHNGVVHLHYERGPAIRGERHDTGTHDRGLDHGQRGPAAARRDAGAHDRARLPARARSHRRQGGLRRGRVRRLLGAGLASRAVRRHAVDRAQRLPAARRRARRPGGRHLRRARWRCTPCTPSSARWRSAAARSAATARRASSAPWPRSTTAATADARPTFDRHSRAERQPLPLHRLSADRRRGGGARRPRRRRPARGPARPGRATGGSRPRCPTVTASSSGRSTSPRRSPLWTSTRTPSSSPASTDFGVEVNLRGPRPCVRRRRRPAARAARRLDVDQTGTRRPRHRRRADAQRGRGGAGRPGAAAGRGEAAVRLAADPQRRDHRRQPRHRLADRRPGACAARARRPAACSPRAGASARSR